MKGKFLNTKNVVIGLVSLVLIGASATGVTIFLKNRGQAEAAGEQVQNLPATGREEQDNNQTNTNPGTVEDPNNQGNNTEIPGAPVEPTTPNTNPGTTTPNQTTGGTTTNPGGNNTTTGIEETVRIERQKVFEDLQLSWTTIGIPAITANMGIFKPELQIEKTATAVIREGEAEQIPVMKENKPMVRAGDTIIYTIQVSNLGNYKATNVVVTDSLDVIFDGKKVPANEELAKIETLEAGKVATLKVGYVVKQADIDAVIETEQNEIIPKDIINIATATDGKTTVEDDDDMPVNPDVTINVNKNWQDNDNQDGKRPEKITVELYRNNENEPVETVTIDASSDWKYVFSNLPKYDEEKNEITYRVVEETVPEYDTEYEISDNGVEIYNHHTPEKVSVEGSKTWNDEENQDGKRPSSITVRLLADGRVVSHKKITEKDNWSWNFEDLPVYEKGEKITYTIKEDSVENYETKLDGYNIINTHKTETTSVSGRKTWNDNNNQDGVRPDSITVELLKTVNGTTTSMGENYKQVLTGNKLDYSWSNLPVYEAGERITYTVKEVGEENGKIVGKNGEKYTVEYDSTGMNITNTYTPKTTSVSGTKTWVDYDNKYNSRPKSITINLLANGGKVDSKTITPQNDSWTYKFKDLPVYKNGQKITYTISEDTVSGYKSKVTGYNVTNTYTAAPTGTITMNWDIQSTTESPIPVDVVFVLDTSWSMIDKDSSRGTNMVKAVNNAIDEILRFNKNNRISVVGYSEYGVLSNLKVPYNNKEHSSVLLPLGRYTANNGQNYLKKSENRIETNIKGEAKKTRYFEAGTFTQAGIQKGAEQLINSTGKTVKVDGKDVQRVPVIIVVSDGEPTVFSTNYTSPLSGKVLGTSQLKNTSAVYGYYTILTANYYKQQVAKAYGTSAKVFTIAMDLTTQYGKTVLNPNNTNVRKCENWRETDTRNQIEDKEISQKLYKYLNNFNQDISVSCSVGFKQDTPGHYINEAKYSNVTVVKNPYSNYSYADRAFANNNMTADDLQSAMIGSITETVSNKKTHDIDENDRKTGKVYLDKIDTTKDFKLEIAGGKTYTSYKDAENDKLVGFDGKKYFVDLTKLTGETVTVNYRQK